MENNNSIEKRPLMSPFDLEKNGADDGLTPDLGEETTVSSSTDDPKPKVDDDKAPPKKPIDDSSTEHNGGDDGVNKKPTAETDGDIDDEGEEIIVKKKSDSVSDNINPEEQSDYAIVAHLWKEKGIIPEDTEIKSDLSSEELDNLVSTVGQNKTESYKEAVKQEILEEFEEQGYTPEMLEAAKMMYNGVPQQKIKEVDVFKQLSEADLTGEDASDDRMKVIAYYYKEKGFSDEKAEKFAQRSFEDETDEQELREAQEYFASKAEKIKEDNIKAAEKAVEDRKKQRKKRIDNLNKLLDSGKINGVQYSQELMDKARSRIFDKTEIWEDEDGKKHRVTYYHKKKLEMAQNPELELENIINTALDFNLESFKESSESRASSKIIDAVAGRTKKRVQNPDLIRKIVSGKENPEDFEIERRAL